MPNIPSPLRPGHAYFSTLLSRGQYMKTQHGTFRIWWHLDSKQERKGCYWNLIGRLVSRRASHESIRLAHLDETVYTKKDSFFGGINQTLDDWSGKRFNEKSLGSLQNVSMKAGNWLTHSLIQPELPKVTAQCDAPAVSSEHSMPWLVSSHQWHWTLDACTAALASDMTAIAATAVDTTTKMDSPLSLLLCFASSHLQVWKECVPLVE